MPDTRIIVFLRAPRTGEVKTRLAASIGAAAACAAYRLMIDHVVAALRSAGFPVELRHTPDDAGGELEGWRVPGWELAPQGEGDLGARMERAFAESVGAGFHRTLIIGTDCPYLTARDLQEASAALDTHELVLGPAVDGGYWLIGMRGLHPDLLRAVPWSSPEVMRVTLDRAKTGRLAVWCLRELEDIDTLAAWESHQSFLASVARAANP